MDRWFDAQALGPFTAYSGPHLIALALLLTLGVLLYLFRRQLRNSALGNGVRILLLAVLVLSEVTLNMWYVWNGRYDPGSTLPLELCSISLYMSAAMLIWRSRRLLQIVYFTGIGGAAQALLTPALDFGFPHYRFIEFFAAHIAIILAVLYMVWVEQQRPSFKSVFVAMIFLNILLPVVGTVNRLTGGNYMFLARKPETASLLDVLGPHPWYLLSLELVAFTLFLLLYLPFAVSNLVKRRRKTAGGIYPAG